MKPAFDGQLAAQISKQLQQQFAPLNNTFTGTLSPQDMAAINKMSGFQQPRQERLSEKAREANIAAFNDQLAANAKAMGEIFVQNTKDKPIEEQYRAYQQAQEALKNQYANLSEEQLGIALTAFNEQADVFAKADKEAGFFARTGDALSYIPTTATKLGEQLTGLFSPDGSARQWFADATNEVESWRSDEAKLRALQSADAMAQAKARGELGFTQFFSNAADNPLETIGQFVESALPTAGSALIGAAAAPITGGASLALPFVVGGVQGAGSARNEIHDHIMAMPEAQLQQNAQYQTLLAKGLSPEQARTELAGSFAEHGGEVLATGLSSAALSGLGGLGRIGQVGKGVMGSTAGKFASELVTEPTDEVFQQLMANKAIRDVDATHSLTDGLGETAAGGLLFGAAGGAVAAADNIYRTPSAESVQQQSDGVVENIVAQGNAEPPQPTAQQTAQPQQAVENPQNVANQPIQAEVELQQSENIAPTQPSVEVDNEADVTNLEPNIETENNPKQLEHQYIDEGRLEQYRQAVNNLLSERRNNQISDQNVISRYTDIAQRFPEHNELASELYRREQEDNEQQILFSQSPMKNIESNIKRGRERMTQAILDKADVKRGMWNSQFGWVDFVWGDDGTTKPLKSNGEPAGRGIAHIFEARQRKDGQDYQQTSKMLVNDIVNTVAKGQVVSQTPSRLVLEYKENPTDLGHKAVLTKDKSHNSNSWLLTGFENDPNKGRKANSADERTVGYGTSTPTQTDPMRSRESLGAAEMPRQTGDDSNIAQSAQNVNQNPQVAQDQATLSRILGEKTASHIQVVDSNTQIPTGQNVKKLAANGVEGWFDVSSQKLYIISDNITANEVLSRDERLAWVAFHELSHAGVRIKFGPILTNVLASAGKNVVVKVLARKIQAEYGYTQEVAIEDAMAEIYAAFETGNWSELESRYKVKIHQSYKQGKDSVGDFLTKVANILRRLIGGIVGKDLTKTMTTSQVFDTLRGIQQGVNDIANTEQNQTASGDVRYSLNEEPNSEFARAVDTVSQGGNVQGYVNVGTTPDVLKMLGLPDTEIRITGGIIQKVMSEYLGVDKGKNSHIHNLTPDTLKQLPQQMNNPVAVFRSSTKADAYVVLTELMEVDVKTGKEKPVVSALHINTGKGNVDVIDVRSVYGRGDNQLSTAFRDDLLYFNKTKGQQFLKTHPLQLHWDLTSDANLSSRNVKTEADLRQYQTENSNNDVRYSVKQSVADLAKTGKAKADQTFIDELKTKDYNGFKKRFDKAVGKLDEWVADGLRPVNDWIDNTLKDSGISAHEAERLKDNMYRAKGVRDALNSELEQAYLKPLLKKVAEVAKKHKLDELSAKRLIGYWASTRYAIEKNNEILAREHQAMLNAEKALNDAKAKGGDIEALSAEYRKAERQYRDRKHDVELALNSDEEFKVGTAGGWSNAEAQHIMENIEKHIPRKELELAVSYLYALNQRRLEIDHKAGRYTEEQYKEFRKNRHYVPLTGDPNADENFDGISGASQNAVNVSKDRALKGRKLSEAEDGIDASWRGINNSTTYAGWVDFKNSIDDIFENTVSELVGKGHSERSAREQAEKTLGISKQRMQGTTRSSDDVLIRKVGGIYYEYKLPQEVITALKNDNVENANAFLKVLSTPTSWYARGVTQWTITFAPMNMLRDTWEKSEFIRVQKLYDKEGNLLDDKTMDKIGRAVLKNAFYNKGTWKATKRMGFNQELRNEGDEALLKQLLELGGVSTYSTYLAKTETDLVKKVKTHNSYLGKKLEQAGSLLESYNKVFDTVSALAAFKAMLDHGVDAKQAAAKTLELTNFRKTGSKMRGIKALYMFSQPTAMGARNLIKYLSTPKGRNRFFGYMAVMMPLYLALRAMDDEDEGGNVMDQLGDITRYIPFPIGDGKYFKFPVGFGMPQMAWNFSVNTVKAIAGDISFTEAGTNMLVHSMKTFAPVSPSEISAAKFPLAKLTLTATPTILQPLMQNVLNRSAFGNQITTNFVVENKLKAEQSKSTTAQFWKDLAVGVNDTFGIDMHPEQIKNLFDGYGAMFGSLRELQTIFIENPNREQLGRRTRTPFLNQFIGTTNEFAVQSRYYEASEEARAFSTRYKSRKERGIMDELSPQDRAMLNWHNLNEKRMGELRAEKGKLTRALREKKINANVYEARIKAYNEKMDKTQRVFIKRWREMQGLNTH